MALPVSKADAATAPFPARADIEKTLSAIGKATAELQQAVRLHAPLLEPMLRQMARCETMEEIVALLGKLEKAVGCRTGPKPPARRPAVRTIMRL